MPLPVDQNDAVVGEGDPNRERQEVEVHLHDGHVVVARGHRQQGHRLAEHLGVGKAAQHQRHTPNHGVGELNQPAINS